MKKAIIAMSVIALLASSCESKKQKEALENAQALAAATQEELVQAVNDRDQLLDIINEITATTEDIKQMEGAVAINMAGSEDGISNAKAVDNLNAIKATLQERRKKLEDLEAALKSSKLSNSKLLTTIENLKNQVASQSAELDALRLNLTSAKEQIASLGGKVDSLNTTVQDVTVQRDSVQTIANEQELLANSCYYAVGSKDELKSNGIVEGGGFLRKSKLNIAEANKGFFKLADTRTLKEIPLHSTKAKVLTSFQPKDSYRIDDVNGQKVLYITNPEAFWSVSKFVVIQID